MCRRANVRPEKPLLIRSYLSVYLPILFGLITGTVIGGFLADTEPTFIGWIFGAGTGLMGGAFIAAVTTNEPLIGHGNKDPRSITYPGEFQEPHEIDDE